MSITDELRTGGIYRLPSNRRVFTEEELTAIADRIDAEHEKATSEFWQRVNAVPATDENMAQHGWMRLPKDADGEYICIGDVMRLGGVKRDLTVLGIGMVNENDGDMGVFVYESDDYVWYNARFLSHYHAPEPDTRERIIEDARFGFVGTKETDAGHIAALVARCKALAGDAE